MVCKKFVLCFDGTGNKFAGDGSDTNLLKIYRMLDRTQTHQYHYYQPGIGTYITSHSFDSTGPFRRVQSAYTKAKDAAIGSSFDQHVLGGYKFLMRFYSPGDEIYFFGFSRGSYTARFLAEMLDCIGLLQPGNEELIRFAWKTFAKWDMRGDSMDDGEKSKLVAYMRAFRETFSRPVTRVKFMGLFDTVNSVPMFENAWMDRRGYSSFVQSSARTIRHAVSIDERRAKFRQDLISMKKGHGGLCEDKADMKALHPGRYRPGREDEDEQDASEVWFAGQHGDVGGGWKLNSNDPWPLSHIPLAWMVKEAQTAGVEFDTMKLKYFNCDEDSTSYSGTLEDTMKNGIVHDCLTYGGGVSALSTLSWRLMEYIPFRRMDLQPDGTWKAIRWPLPGGEVRDMPHGAEIHGSVIHRMQIDEKYRPGNLIVGGGGRGVKKAEEKDGIGEWVVCNYKGDA
ncbi:hypothetical protein MW887_003178 [Aspergillus wentii]|nr:hypothetical protein MW887_003178 [Aspergillus wentii]